MRDPLEGIGPDGFIRTGVGRVPLAAAFEPIVEAVTAGFEALGEPAAELHLYGSVATGVARPGTSDVDLLVIDVPTDWAVDTGRELSRRFAGLCRGVEIGTGTAADFVGDGDEAYGNRVFLRHYCRQVAGPHTLRPAHDFPADVHAARGFNGDIARSLDRWRSGQRTARGVARKSLVAAAGVISIRANIWTTDRATAARMWTSLEPDRTPELDELLSWADDSVLPSDARLDAVLGDGGLVAAITERFVAEIGSWDA